MALPYLVQELVTFVLPFAILAVLALGLNLQWGHTGQFNAGVAAFYAIGAYAAGFLLTGPAPPLVVGGAVIYPGHLGGFSQPFLVGLVGAFFFSAIAGLLIGMLTLRLRADYLAIATLALAEIFRLFLKNAQSLTAGTIGVIRIPRPLDGLITTGPESDAGLALIVVAVLLAVLLVIEWMTRSPWGRALRAIREDEEAAQVMGKDTFWLQLQAFAIGCGIMGLAGALLAVFNRVLVPDLFVPFTTFSVYVVVLLGGAGNNRGAVVGAAIFYLFDWSSIRLKDYMPPLVADRIAYYRLIVIGILLILLVMYRPQGVLPEKKYVPRGR